MKTNIIIAVLFIISCSAVAQNYTTTGDGNWTAPGKWSNNSGWGSSTPPVDGSHGSGTITMQNNMTLGGSYNTGSAVLNIMSGKTLTINNTMTVGGGSTVNVYGNLVINGDLTLNGFLNIFPGGSVSVNGTMTVVSANYLTVGTSTNPPPYADLIIKSDLKQVSSGDVTLNRNARVAVFGSVIGDNGGGTSLTLNNGAQMYVHGNVSYIGGSDAITNNNTLSPYGLYVNGTTSNTGGGASTTSNKTNRATMQTTNPAFTSWVNNAQTTMPVTLITFEVANVSDDAITLKWQTGTEENFDHFILESSNNGVDFFELVHVAGGRFNYTYDVEHPVVGKTYFRLISVDLDGSTETFKVISAVYESSKTVKIFPNPVVDSKVNLDFNFSPAEDVTVSITNLSGMEVMRQSVKDVSNLLMLSLDPGTYIMKIQSWEVSSITRIVIR